MMFAIFHYTAPVRCGSHRTMVKNASRFEWQELKDDFVCKSKIILSLGCNCFCLRPIYMIFSLISEPFPGENFVSKNAFNSPIRPDGINFVFPVSRG